PENDLTDIKLVELIIKARATDFEKTCSLHPISRSLLQRLEYANPLSLHRRISPNRSEIGGFNLRPDGDQIRTRQFFMGRGDHGTLDVVLQLANVAGPGRSG